MGHLIFIVLHFIAILLGFVFLFITIPLHLIYAVQQSKVDRSQKRKCPHCAEEVKIEALVCKHCGKDLEKFDAKKEEPVITPNPKIKNGKVFLILIIIFATLMAYFAINKTPKEKPPRPSMESTK